MTAPVVGSASWPSWIARVSNSMLWMLVRRELDALGAEKAREAPERAVEAGEIAVGLRVDPVDAEHACAAVVLGVDPPDQTLPPENGQDEVPVLALRLRDVDLHPVAEAP